MDNMDPFNETLKQEQLKDVKVLRRILQYKIITYLQRSVEKLSKLNDEKLKLLDIWNNSQVFYLQEMSLAYAQLFVFDCFDRYLQENKHKLPKDSYDVVYKLHLVFGLTNIVNDIGVIRENDFVNTDSVYVIKEVLLKLCEELKDEIIGLVEVIAPEDYNLQSVLGSRDVKNPFETFFDKTMEYENSSGRASWWKILYEN